MYTTNATYIHNLFNLREQWIHGVNMNNKCIHCFLSINDDKTKYHFGKTIPVQKKGSKNDTA